MLKFRQGYAAFRRTAAILASAAILVLFGVRNVLFILGGTLLLWPFAQLIVNSYRARRLPLWLVPWSPPKRRTRSKRADKNPLWDPDVPEIFPHNK